MKHRNCNPDTALAASVSNPMACAHTKSCNITGDTFNNLSGFQALSPEEIHTEDAVKEGTLSCIHNKRNGHITSARISGDSWLAISLLVIMLAISVKSGYAFGDGGKTLLWNENISVIPYPQSVAFVGDDFVFGEVVYITLDSDATDEELFAANKLSRQLGELWEIEGRVIADSENTGIILTLEEASEELGQQGYRIETGSNGITIMANSATGLFYGVQTLLQLIQEKNNEVTVRGLDISDWPDIPIRAAHYDSKHFQEKKEYVFEFIRTLAKYKINMLIWEWEDKFAYESHPEIGAPGAFSMREMQEFTRYAQKYHIEIVPLVQGLGHVSFILKHPEKRHLRENESNNWGFCPFNEETYDLMADLIKESVQATPGSGYFHIGCDETYHLGEGADCGCSEMMEKEGTRALRYVYINKVAELVKEHDRIPMVWDSGYMPDETVQPVEGLFAWGNPREPRHTEIAVEKGYSKYVYDPNPGIEHLFLPYFYRQRFGEPVSSHLEQSYERLTEAASTGLYEGMISTSWDCSGVHNQIWMLRYITGAEYSWSSIGPGLEEFSDSYFHNYYGPDGRDIRELFTLLNETSYFYMDSFERRVWHWGEIGKTHLPDLPRDDMEYDPFWNSRYAGMVEKSEKVVLQMDRALAISEDNLNRGVRHAYDFELFNGLAKLFRHTANTWIALSELEQSVTKAAGFHFHDNPAVYEELKNARKIIENNLDDRHRVFEEIKYVWEKSQLPKGFSTPEKPYVHARDQQRNFANRRPDLSFMIYDEEMLGLEEYLENLDRFMNDYSEKYLDILDD